MSNVRQNTSNFDPLRNWEENGTALQPVTAGYNLGTSGNEVGNLLMTGSLGIGTATPGQLLEVQVAGDGSAANFGNTSGRNLHIGAQTTPSGCWLGYGGDQDITILSTGNVGIGATAPTAALQVVGDTHAGAGNTGTNCNFVGSGAGTGNSGANCSAFGYQSLFSSASGDSNSAVGMRCLYGITTGSNLSALGLQAGRYIANGTTANATSGTSVYLGSNTKALADGGANEIVIGDTAIGLGSNTAVLGNSSIATTRLQGSVGIGRDVPAEALHVQLNVRANGRFLASQGTAASPSYGFSDDGDIGLFRLTTNTLGISTTGVTRLAIGPTGNVGIGTDTPDANALLDITSTTKAFLPPRMTTTQKGAVASPTAGMVVYDSTLSKLAVYTGAAWEAITSA